MNPIFLIDFYKVGHVWQYPPDTEQVWSNWTPRYSHVEGTKEVVHFGLQYFLKEYLTRQFDLNFFGVPINTVVSEYKSLIKNTLGVEPDTKHIEYLHKLQHLPLDIYSIPEGDAAPLKVPSMVLTNTDPKCFWLPNYLESLMSAVLWRPSTSATTAKRYRKIFEDAAKSYYGPKADLGFVAWQGHDFSFRGMGGVEDAILSGMGHLTSFNGTDTIPAILGAVKYYGAQQTCGGSVPATEHSVMSAYGNENEFGTFERLLTEVYPKGILSVVSDTWDLWRVLEDYMPRLKDTILGREGKLVIRPDSGDPVEISLKTAESLAKTFGVNKDGMINSAGVIYGDSITPVRASAILNGLSDRSLSPYNQVFGIGSYTYAYVTRDTYGFAMKATAVKRNGKIIPIFKSPVTDPGGKISLKGIPIVYNKVDSDPEHAGYYVKEGVDPTQLDNCAFVKVFEDGFIKKQWTFDEVRRRVRE